MTHDPLCLVSKNSPVCLHCAGENDNRGKSNYCSDCWDHYVGGLDQFEPVHECECDLIAKVRADELRRPSEDGWMSVRAVLAWEDQVRADERKRVANYLRDEAVGPTMEAEAWAFAYAEAIDALGEKP